MCLRSLRLIQRPGFNLRATSSLFLFATVEDSLQEVGSLFGKFTALLCGLKFVILLYIVFLLTGLHINTGEYKAQGGGHYEGPRALDLTKISFFSPF